MVLWIILLCLFPITFAASDFAAPELLADYGPNSSLQPYENAWQDKDSPREPHLIRGLLVARDTSPSRVGLQGGAPPNDLRFIPGPLMATDALPLTDGFQDWVPSEDLHLIRGLLMTRGTSPFRRDIAFPRGGRLIRGLLMTRGVSPGVLVNSDTDADLQPLGDLLPSGNPSEGSHLIRGLLWPRAPCPTGYGQCSNDATRLELPLQFPYSTLPFLLALWSSLSGRPRLAPGDTGAFGAGISGRKVHLVIVGYGRGLWNSAGVFRQDRLKSSRHPDLPIDDT